MADELPILKGILNGLVNYHNAPVRFGRVPKREKARILAAMQQSSNSRTLEKAVAAELEDEQRLMAAVVRAHLDTCDFTRDKVEPMLARARDQPSYTACPPTLACPLNPNPQPLTGQQELLQDFSKRFSPAIRGVVEFAKRIPGFSLLAQDDQVTLLKAGVFEVLLVRLACMFDAHTSSMVCLNGQLLRRDAVHNNSNARFLMDSMFDFAERVNALRLSDAEVGLFCSVVVIAADRPGLRNTELVERMHAKLRAALHAVMAQNRPGHPDACQELMKKIPDLRTLNTLHSEKLLAFKMTEQQQQHQSAQQAAQQAAALHYSHHQQQLHQQLQQSCAQVDEDIVTKSPSWSSASDVTMDDAKSPLGSVSSTESMCSGEIASITTSDYHLHPHLHHQQQQQQQQQQQHQHHHLQQVQQRPPTVTPVSQHASSAPLLAATLAGGLCPHRHRANSGSTSSSGDDELAAAAHLVHNGLTITPVSRAASAAGTAPTSHYMHHQRFRKLDSPSDSGIESGTEKLDKMPGSTPTSLCSSPRSSLEDQPEDHHHHQRTAHMHSQHHSTAVVEDMPVLKRVLQAPPLYDTNSLMDEAYKPHKKFRALRQKDSAEAEPAIMAPSPPLQPVAVPVSVTPNHHQSSLSSTHSTLAKSLMEGPRMTAEQLKRTDIIHNYIMRAESTATSASGDQSALRFHSTPSSPTYGHSTSVITTTTGQRQTGTPTYVLLSNGTPPPVLNHQQYHQSSPQPQLTELPRIYFHSQSPSSSSSPAPLSVSAAATPKMVELQVDIAESQQPLNLSKKSPSPSPVPAPTAMEV